MEDDYDGIAHDQTIVGALHETIGIMGEIDDVIEAHGGWADFPEVNLYNKDGLPASPFGTEDFLRNL